MKVSDKPSIFNDRSSIGSSEELDEYGVWVKSEPEDLIAGSEDESFALSKDFNLDESDTAKSFDIDFSSGIPEISSETDTISEHEAEGVSTETVPDAAFDFDGFIDEGTQDTSVDFPDLETVSQDADAAIPAEDAVSETDVIESPADFELSEEDAATFNDAESALIEVEPTEVYQEDAAEPHTTKPDDGHFDIDFEIDDSDTNDSFDLDFAADEDTIVKKDEESIPEETAFTETEAFDTFDDGAFEPEPVEAEEFLEPESEKITESGAADKIEADFSEPKPDEIETYDNVVPSQAPPTNNANETTTLLLRIANELSTIKSELDGLKSEISDLKAAGISSEGKAAAIDEEVALTGEELNDVINNADITQESDIMVAELPDDLPDAGISDVTNNDSALATESEQDDSTLNEQISFDENELTNLGELDDSISIPENELENLSKLDNSISIPENELAPLDDTDASISLTGEELHNLDEMDESISLTDDELDNLQDVDERISLSNNELDALDQSGLAAEPQMDAPTEDENEALTGDELSQILNTAEITDETSSNVDSPEDPALSALANNGFDDPAQSVEDISNADIILQSDESPAKPETSSFDIVNVPPDAEEIEISIPTEQLPAEIRQPPVEAPAPLPTEEQEPASSLPAPVPPPEKKEVLNEKFKNEIRTVLAYMDQLLESLPEDKIEEFARSDKFDVYKKVFKDLGLV